MKGKKKPSDRYTFASVCVFPAFRILISRLSPPNYLVSINRTNQRVLLLLAWPAMNPSSSSSTDPGDTVVYPATATLPVFYTVIPASIRRRFPRLYYSLHKSFRSSSNNADSNGKNNSHELNAHGLTSASEPQLAYYRESIVSGVANEVAAGTSAPAPGSPQHPLTAHSTTSNGYDLDREGSLSSVDTDNNSNSSSVSVSEGGEGLSTATGNSATATKYETGSGLRWNRVVPGMFSIRFLFTYGFDDVTITDFCMTISIQSPSKRRV